MPALPQVALEEEGDSQRVRLSSTLPGKLLLHWGVEGGADYQGGWRLPGQAAWPEGTVQYKDRALQTPWKCGRSSLPLAMLAPASAVDSAPAVWAGRAAARRLQECMAKGMAQWCGGSRQREGGGQELSIVLAGQEASDYLDFVIKNESTGTWCGAGGPG